ncbi:lysine--tRNA ligase, partial [Arthrobacter deserti]|nr:lysine--tRNA ligase [Arthrobacter deserti]
MTREHPATPAQPIEPADASEQMRVRMEKRAKLLERGMEPYPVGVERTHTLSEIREKSGHLEPDETTGDIAGVSGRVVFVRNPDKLCFATLQEGNGTRLQAMLSLANVGEEALADW